MKLRFASCLILGMVLFAGGSVFAQQPLLTADDPDSAAAQSAVNSSPMPPQQATPAAGPAAPAPPAKHMLGPIEVSVNWRTRAEGWYWFEGADREQ